MRVAKVADLVGDEIIIISRPRLPDAAGNFRAILINTPATADADPGPSWVMILEIGDSPNRRKIRIDLEAFLSAEEYKQSFVEPVQIAKPIVLSERDQNVFIFRDNFFLTERLIRTNACHEEAILRIKKLVYDAEGEITALRSFVANIETAIEYQRPGPQREPIPDDVKLLVWARDRAACTRCGSNEKLQFDHIIPVAKGGGNGANNIQLLCQACNLKKSDKIVF